MSQNAAPATKSHTPTSPNTAPAKQNESHHWSTSHMKRHLQCAEQQESPSNFTKYCACHAKWSSWLILITYEASLTMRRATGIPLQPHQILRLPRKIAFQNLRNIHQKQLKCHLQCATDPAMIRTRSDHELVISHPPVRWGYFSRFGDACLPRKMTVQNLNEICWKHMKRRLQCAADPRMIRPWNRQPATRLATEVTFRAPEQHFVLKKYNISRSGYHSKFHRILRLPRKVTPQLHQILRLPRKITFIIDPCHIWNVNYNARSNTCHCPTSPNTAPVT